MNALRIAGTHNNTLVDDVDCCIFVVLPQPKDKEDTRGKRTRSHSPNKDRYLNHECLNYYAVIIVSDVQSYLVD